MKEIDDIVRKRKSQGKKKTSLANKERAQLYRDRFKKGTQDNNISLAENVLVLPIYSKMFRLVWWFGNILDWLYVKIIIISSYVHAVIMISVKSFKIRVSDIKKARKCSLDFDQLLFLTFCCAPNIFFTVSILMEVTVTRTAHNIFCSEISVLPQNYLV